MKNKQKKAWSFAIAITLATMLCIVAVIGCKDEPDPTPQPQPVAQSYQINGITNTNGSGTINVTVNYTALPNTVPNYMPTLEEVVRIVLGATAETGTLTINVISGDSGFTLTSPRTLSVGESWLSNKTRIEIGQALTTAVPEWVSGNDPQKQTPVIEDFNISGTGTYDYDGTAKTVTITRKANKTTGAITIYYNGTTTAPIAINTYTVTFNVAEAEGYNAVNGLSAGTITIVEQTQLRSEDITLALGDNTYTATVEATLLRADMDTVKNKLTTNIVTAFSVGIPPVKAGFRNVFNDTVNPRGKVKIIIENNVNYETYVVANKANVYFNYTYLNTVSDTDLQTAITSAVASMNSTIGSTNTWTITLPLTFGTGCAVTVKSDDQFTADQWASLCNDVVTAIMRGYNNAPSNGAKIALEGHFSSHNISVVLLKSATYDIEVKSNDHNTLYLKADSTAINAISGINVFYALGYMMNEDDSSYHYPE